MKTPVPPYHNTGDQLLYALLTGGDCLAYEQLSVNDFEMIRLNPPPDSLYALLVVEADATTFDKSRIVRFMEDPGSINPTANIGVPLGDLSVYEVKGRNNLQRFRIIGIEADKIHRVRIQYYG